MRNLKGALQSVLPDLTSLGGDTQNVDRQKLARVLTELVSDLGRTLIQRSLLAAFIVIVLALIGWRYMDEPAPLIGALAALGVVLVGTMGALRQVTDELARARMLLALAPELSREALTEIARWMTISN